MRGHGESRRGKNETLLNHCGFLLLVYQAKTARTQYKLRAVAAGWEMGGPQEEKGVPVPPCHWFSSSKGDTVAQLSPRGRLKVYDMEEDE